MRIPMTAKLGCAVWLATTIGYFAARGWIETRTLRALDMPVSLSRQTISAAFDLNIHGYYSILFGLYRGGDLKCNGVGLETRRISSFGGLSVYHYQWQITSPTQETIGGAFAGGFEGKPGHYNLKIEILSDTGCLDSSNPRLYVIASNDDFNRWTARYEYLWWISLLGAISGLVLVVAALNTAIRSRTEQSGNLGLFG